ncbi:hypothetical protein [Xanthomonas maliensis]|uniref:hypothetical protein n=1 Tax=Xanthomonas maliensis TaxID=1321368 RepID=UPI0003A0978B|nr:hypothetical protein [Xanthomonas maliensis]KAB7771929.1 hypothetical protein CKY51_02020 [Xanthomonas maliensis]
MNPELDAELNQLAADLPELRRQHPDDFWDVFHARTDAITARASQDEAVHVARRIDDLLAAHQLGPADPGA